MIHELAAEIIRQTAQAAGLPEGRVIDQPKADNLTLPRPRLELQFLQENYTKSGQTLAFTRSRDSLQQKRELYVVTLAVAANVLADNDEWLAGFCYDFTRLLPRGTNDSRGNWVRIAATSSTFGRQPAPRIGNANIEVFRKLNRLFSIDLTWRVTDEEAFSLIPAFTITTNWKGAIYGQEK